MTMPEYQDPYPRLSTREELLGRDGKRYFAHRDLLAAANAALEIEAPLLLTGEPGCGKTDFAYAAASRLVEPIGDEKVGKPLECYVRSDSRARDLLFHYDAVRRFGDAQHGGPTGVERAQDPRNYLKLQPLGRGLMSTRPEVVLIDEIDKAPRDLPNDLLRELDQGHFEIPEIPDADPQPDEPIRLGEPSTYRHTMRRPEGVAKPLVIITSNVERQLPDAFLRRCVFFHIEFPDDDALGEILRSRFGDAERLFLDRVIGVFKSLRDFRPALTKKPATSELLQWTQVLRRVYRPETALQALNAFVGSSDESSREPSWGSLPALECLIKLREDRSRLLGNR